ncbi:3-ketoacyl-CoA synthase 6 [Acorus calamus]|uniref:3-ketoacyl-CoA synthase 6 n=1 Tax=Acorus calamus TaxID=4465 RepID=A0AAV9F286_ACOCL|nr:3-ketoacyl-CoA synthase 6 [Acorus calamus]
MDNNPLHLLILTLLLRTPKHIYLLDFACHKPSDSDRAPTATYLEHYALYDRLAPASVTFLTKILERSGIGPESCVPDATHVLPPPPPPPDESLRAARAEIESVLFDAVADLFERTRSVADPRDVEVIVSNCSLTCPTPSIAAMVANRMGGAAVLLSNRERDRSASKYVLRRLVRTHLGSQDRAYRSNVMSFSLSGMGCSAGILSVSMARDLLKVHNNSVALVLSMEAVTVGGYEGKVKSMLLANCLFRMGGRAMIEAIEENLQLREEEVEASKMALYRFGNTSSSSTWYALCYLEAKGRGGEGDSIKKLAI